MVDSARHRRLRRPNSLVVVFCAAGSLLVLFVAWPLLSTILATSPALLWATLTDPEVLASLWLTFYASALATGVALVTGVPLAYLLARYEFPGKGLVTGLIDLPVIIPHTAAGVALLMVFGRQAPLGRLGSAVGLHFTEDVAGIVVAMLFVSLPFLVNTARETFALIDPELERVAWVLGASPWQAFRYVILPLAWRGILAGALMAWARGISEFGAVVILAYHPQVIPVLVYERFAGFGLSAALPVAVILILAALVTLTTLRALLGRQHAALQSWD
ncbi:MAG: ABC transporter permease [Chloroflexi bacterium]|nr:ABC transporter permease [Chloroflexota bacterium]MBU1752204.1 ABC transporter permease [Chloroflexota bacterium]